jgi:RNA polymerase sigma-70 factor (ECF subfamily)
MVADWSDSELVQGMLAGARPAWRVFSERYDALIYAAIDRVLRCFPALSNRNERDEVRAALLSSLVARQMHKLRVFEFERGVRLSTWLHLLATHAARDHVRAASRGRPITLGCSRWCQTSDEGSAGPLAALLAKEELSQASSALARFSDKDRQLVDLLIVQGQAPEQVASAMNISVKTVYTKKHKLVSRLQRVMGN